MTSSTLDITPRANTARGAVSNAETPKPSHLSDIGSAFRRTTQPDYDKWIGHVRAAAGCTRPLRLTGSINTVNGAGQVLNSRHTEQLPDGVIYKACGNRRASVCPSCARTYQNDAYQLIRAGLVGGKGIPESVASHPATFATFTAPSFGPVHTRYVRKHTCRNRKRCDCRAEPCRARTGNSAAVCAHGVPVACFARHERGDRQLGTPICLDCYDYDHQAVWNLSSGELWRRTKQAADRHLRTLCRRRGIPFVQVPNDGGNTRYLPPVRIAHGKVAEFQQRGAVHFHALIRLDGVNPHDLGAVVAPPAGITVDDLHQALEHAAEQIAFTTAPHPDRPAGWPMSWGTQLDLRALTLRGSGEVTDGMAAGYLAKYATKSTEVTGHNSTRITIDNIDTHANHDGTHMQRLIAACWHLGRPFDTGRPMPERRRPTTLGAAWTCDGCGTRTRLRVCSHCEPTRQDDVDTKTANGRDSGNPYSGLRRWAHMLGYGGHFFTKARRYSTTFAVLRASRVEFRRAADNDDQAVVTGGLIRTADHLGEETPLIVGALTFAGVGWRTTGDALLANTAADLARIRREVAREEIAHELGTTPATP